jgi:UPF0271 protein
MTRAIDLNADVGEGFADAELMPFLSSCSIACGGHAGDEDTMREAVRLAVKYDLAIGAHPSFLDRAGFGRTVTTNDPAAIEALVSAQIVRLADVARREGARLAHVKPHGALYNLAARDGDVARAVARAVRRTAPDAALLLLASSGALAVARAEGLRVLAEGFADRGYRADGTLAPRGSTGALITDPDGAADQALSIAAHGRVTTIDGRSLALAADTLCLHSDTPGATAIAERVNRRLRDAGIAIARGAS